MPSRRGSVVIVRGEGVLLIEHPRRGLGYWVVPGGRPENFEPIPAAVACEIREETGLDVNVEAPRRGLRGQRSVAPSRAKACVGYACRQRTREKHHVDHGDQ